MSSLRNRRRNRIDHPGPAPRKRSPLRNLEPLEDRIAPAISIVNLALSGGPISEDTATLRTLSGALAAPALTDVDLAIAWGDGSSVQHTTVAAGQLNFQLDHTFFFPDVNPRSATFTVSVSASYSNSNVFVGPNVTGYVAATVPFQNIDLQRGQAGVVDLGSPSDNGFVGFNLNADSFTFYGAKKTGTIFVGSNGFITFGAGSTASASDDMGNASQLSPAAIAPLWDHWRTDRGGRLLAKLVDLDQNGVNDWLVVEWCSVKLANGGGNATFQAILQLNTGSDDGDAWFNYVDNRVNYGNNVASIGVKNANRSPADPLLVSQNPSGANFASGHAVVVTHNPTPTATLTGIVNPIVPSNLQLAVTPSSIDEGGTVTLAGSFTDPSASDTHTVTVAWGDRTFSTVSLGAGVTSFSGATHQYLDENPAGTPYTVTVTVADDDGATTSATASVAVSDVVPSNLNLTVAPATIDEGGTVTLIGSFTDPAPSDTHTVTVAWGDGTSSTVSLGAGVTSFSGGTHQYVDENPSGPSYTLTVTVADDDGATTSGTASVTVNNAIPSNLILTVAPATIDEGGTVALSGSFTDPAPNDTHTVTVLWGDGTSSTVSLGAGVTSFSGSTHQYVDENPSGPSYSLTVTVADDDGATTSGTASVTVNNVVPSNLNLTVAPATIDEGGTVTLSGSFTDSAPNDTHTVTVAWGDRTSSTVSLGAGVTSFSGATHQYLDENPAGTPYTVTVTVADDDGATTSGTASVTVNNVVPSNLILTVAPATIDEGGTVTLIGSFTDPAPSDTHTVTVAWGDGTSSTVSLGAGVTVFSGATHQYVDENPSGPSYTVTVTVADDDGATTAGTASVIVNNVAPTIASVSVSPTAINEGQSVTLTGSFTDPGTLDTFTATVTWGDGTSGSATVSGHTFTATHLYDNNPAGTASGTFTIAVTVTDNGGASTTDSSTTVTVSNVAPTGTLSNSGPVDEGGTATVTVSNQFDPSVADTVAGFRYSFDLNNDGTFDIGNGQTWAGSVANATATVPSSLLDDGPGVLHVRTRIFDQDGGFTDLFTDITINNVAPTATLSANGPFTAGQPITFTFGNQFDPSHADTVAGFRYYFDFDNDGTFDVSNSTSPSAAHTFAAPGTYTVHGRIADKDGGFTDVSTTVTANPGSVLVVGADAGGLPEVKVYYAVTGTLKSDFNAYGPLFSGGVRVAAADVNGDGVPDIITGAGPGGGPHVKVFDGVTGNELYSFFAFQSYFAGGVYVAGADINGDGKADIIVSTGFGNDSQVSVFDGATGQLIRNFTAYVNFGGAVTVAAADVNGDGVPDIITGAGPGGGPHVKVFDGKTNAVIYSFFAFDPTYTGGIYVAAGDLNGDGHADLIVSQGAGFSAGVRTFSGLNSQLMGDFTPFAGLAQPPNGVHVAAVDRDGDGKADVVVGTGPQTTTQVRSFNGMTLTQMNQFSPFDPGFLGGVFVG